MATPAWEEKGVVFALAHEPKTTKVKGLPVPIFPLAVKGARIAYIEFSGPREGEFLAADEVRFTPVEGEK